MRKFKIEFEGFDDVINQMQQANGNVRNTTERALKRTDDIVYQKAKTAISKHRKTGKTEASLQKSPPVIWEGDVASVQSGFDIEKGGLPSIFLMRGTPKMPKDQELYNAFYGKRTIDEIENAQADIFFDELRKVK